MKLRKGLGYNLTKSKVKEEVVAFPASAQHSYSVVYSLMTDTLKDRKIPLTLQNIQHFPERKEMKLNYCKQN